MHRDTVRAAIETDPLHRPRRLRLSRLDPYLPFLRETLEQYPRLRATRLLEMIRLRGYARSIQRLQCVQLPARARAPVTAGGRGRGTPSQLGLWRSSARPSCDGVSPCR